VSFATKPKLGIAMLERALDAGVPCAWVSGDCVYGGDSALRRFLERRQVGYVLFGAPPSRLCTGGDQAVTSAQHLGLVPVLDWVEDVPADGWHRLSAGAGAKGPRLSDWALLPFRGAVPADWAKGLLIRRSLGEKQELAFYLTAAPPGTTLADLVRVAGTRWTIEECFEAAKGEIGLDQYEVRSWTGWYRHITLAMLALAYLTVVRKAAIGGTGPRRSRRRSRRRSGRRSRRRSRRRSVALDRAGDPPLAVPPRHPETRRSQRRYRLVVLAKAAPATGTAQPLEAAYSKQ
jgi:SRSO17 transposase